MPEDVTEPVLKHREWLSVREFAIRENVTEKTIHNRIKAGTYTSRLGKDGRTQVLLLTEKKETVTEALQSEQLKNARLEERLDAKDAIIESLRSELARADEAISTLKDAIGAHQTANEALNNERAVINQKLQKYREPESPKEERKGKWWQLWR